MLCKRIYCVHTNTGDVLAAKLIVLHCSVQWSIASVTTFVGLHDNAASGHVLGVRMTKCCPLLELFMS